MNYGHAHETGRITGAVRGADGGSFSYTAALTAAGRFAASEPGSLAEFAMERYTAFALRARSEVVFRVWHQPWLQVPVEVQVSDAGLLVRSGEWHRFARLAGANYTVGCREVWMGRVSRVRPPGGRPRRGSGVLSAFYEMP